jgi:hypothetical protein
VHNFYRRKPVFASPWKSGLHPAQFKDFFGTLLSQRSARNGNCRERLKARIRRICEADSQNHRSEAQIILPLQLERDAASSKKISTRR